MTPVRAVMAVDAEIAARAMRRIRDCLAQRLFDDITAVSPGQQWLNSFRKIGFARGSGRDLQTPILLACSVIASSIRSTATSL